MNRKHFAAIENGVEGWFAGRLEPTEVTIYPTMVELVLINTEGDDCFQVFLVDGNYSHLLNRFEGIDNNNIRTYPPRLGYLVKFDGAPALVLWDITNDETESQIFEASIVLSLENFPLIQAKINSMKQKQKSPTS